MNCLALWIWVSATASMAGWLLSAMGQLNRTGYVVFAVVSAAVLFSCRTQLGLSTHARSLTSTRVLRRFRRPLPFCFCVLAALVFLGGALYSPTNHTALSYRTSRVLHWLSEGHWLWIHTPNYRMNDRACGIEWLSAPLFLFLRSDRLFFLLNFVPYLLLPGLVFSICRSLGVCGRVAWQWMWIFPTGYSFLLQAASAGNDTFPTVYALASVYFGFRAWKTKYVSDVWLSIVSAALLTGAKASNLPLLLPWAMVLVPLFGSIKQNVPGTIAVVIVSLVVSFLPTALLNIHYCGDWSGLRMEISGMNMKSPLVGIWGNSLIFLLDNLVPPFFPMAGWWNQHALTVLPQFIVRPMRANFEGGFHILGELPTEDWVGIGFGLSWLVVLSTAAGFYLGRKGRGTICRSEDPAVPRLLVRALLVAPWISLLAYCMKSGMVTGARLISPYYPLLLPSLLVMKAQSFLVRQCWWRSFVWLMVFLAFPVLILTPGRPLWPAQTILAKLHVAHPGSRPIARALEVYKVYSIRADPLADVRTLLPAGLATIGFMASEDDIEVSIWRPFGRRVVKHLLVSDSGEAIRARGIEYVVVGGFNLKLRGTTLEEWLQKTGGEVIGSVFVTVKVAEGPQPWYVVRLKKSL